MQSYFSHLTAALLLTGAAYAATQVDIEGPPGSEEFGHSVTVLPNGNFVVTDPFFDKVSPPATDVGAVYLYNPEGALISALTGTGTNSGVGSGGVTILANGNFVVISPNWGDNRGAVTWGSATTGFIDGPNAVVTILNSLIGTSFNDFVGSPGVAALTNGNYVVRSSQWNHTSTSANAAGAATWGSGTTGITGRVSSANSLVGTSAFDHAGLIVTELTNGNYVVGSPYWDNNAPTASNAGAATWVDGTTGITGPVSATNSLVGTSTNDQVGGSDITVLTNGNYVVRTPNWDNPATATATADAGAVTWGLGTTGITGPVSATNSLVGTTPGDQVGSNGVTALTNGHYVVRSAVWNNPEPSIANVGAVTWGNGVLGITGTVSTANSLIGSSANDSVGAGLIALTNGNYVVNCSDWDQTSPRTVNVGAVAWGNGFTGIKGPVTSANSLVGTLAEERIGNGGVTALTNGNYVVTSTNWNQTAGAVTWGRGTAGITGHVTAANSLVGSSPGDQVGGSGITALTNGHYVVRSAFWDNTAPAIENAGAVTWGNGFTGIKGPVTAANSLVGTSNFDSVGFSGVTALTSGNYVVRSAYWNNPVTAATSAGAVTWGEGTTGIKGPVTAANSLVGTSPSDSVGSSGVTALTNGNYVVSSPDWNNRALAAEVAGAVTWGCGVTGITGPVTIANSLVGSTLHDQVGSSGVIALSNGHYAFFSPDWDNTALIAADAGAVCLGNGWSGTTGHVGSANSVLGAVANVSHIPVFDYDPSRHQLIVGRSGNNLVTRFRGDQLLSLAKAGLPVPEETDIAYGRPGMAAVNASGSTLADFSLTGSEASKGRNRAIFAFSPVAGADLVLQSGTALSSLGSGLPSNAVAISLHGQVLNQPNRGLFQATVKGTGISAVNNRLLLLDNGSSVSLLHRSGTPITVLGNATLTRFTEVMQSHDQDLITVTYKLKSGGDINATNDEGLLFLDHSGVVGSNIAAREGEPAFGGGGNFGSFKGRAAAGLGTTIHFTALFKPSAGKPIPAVFSATLNGISTDRVAKSGDRALDSSDAATFNTFTSISQQGSQALVKATLKNSPSSQNEGLYRLRALSPGQPPADRLMRKGQFIGGGLTITRILRFWPAGPGQVIIHVQVTGTNVNNSNNQMLLLRRNDQRYSFLLRTGTPAPGTGPATLKTISAVDVNPVSGLYAVLGTLSGAPSSSNQALWTGNTTLGDDFDLQALRLPQLTLRKGNPYSTEATPSGIIRSIALKPAIDPTGAGGRGLAHALGASGDLAIFITGDRNVTELVLLDR